MMKLAGKLAVELRIISLTITSTVMGSHLIDLTLMVCMYIYSSF